MHPVLRDIEISDFKSFREATLPLAPLTLLIGANASGKSNALEAIRFLAWLASGRRIDEIVQAVQESDLRIRGTLGDLARHGRQSFRLGCSLEHERIWRLEIEIAVSRSEARVAAETVDSDGFGFPLYRTEGIGNPESHLLTVAYNNFSRGGKKPLIQCTDYQAVLTQLTTPARFWASHSKAQKEIPATTEMLRRALQGVLFLEPDPRRMRDYSFRADNTLRSDGSNLSSVLHELCLLPSGEADILGFVGELPEQPIVGLTFLEGPRDEVMVQVVETFGGTHRKVDAPLLSDGTLRVMAVAAALLSAPAGSLVIIEEIDNGVHPSRAERLLKDVRRVATERDLRVLLTTHNPALLDALPLTAVPEVVFCYRDREAGDSRLLRLADLERYPSLVAQGPLGSLLTRSVVDRFAKARDGGDDGTAASLRWLDQVWEEAPVP